MRWSSQRGQTAAEYLGLLLVVSVIVAAVATSNAGATIRHQLSEQVCKIAGGTCKAQPDRSAARTRPVSTGEPVVAHAANIPCDGMTPRECTALRGLINRALAEHEQAREAYIHYAADFAVWVAGAEGIKDIRDVINRPGIFKAVNALLRKETNREGARLLTSVKNTPLANLIKSNYRYGARIGKGSTADALRDEVARGVKYGAKKSHYKKAQESIRRLNKILDTESLSARESQIATNIRGELYQTLPPQYRVPLR
jgi:hypothetical protein